MSKNFFGSAPKSPKGDLITPLQGGRGVNPKWWRIRESNP